MKRTGWAENSHPMWVQLQFEGEDLPHSWKKNCKKSRENKNIDLISFILSIYYLFNYAISHRCRKTLELRCGLRRDLNICTPSVVSSAWSGSVFPSEITCWQNKCTRRFYSLTSGSLQSALRVWQINEQMYTRLNAIKGTRNFLTHFLLHFHQDVLSCLAPASLSPSPQVPRKQDKWCLFNLQLVFPRPKKFSPNLSEDCSQRNVHFLAQRPQERYNIK